MQQCMGRPKLLVIDDEPAITALIGRIAADCGYEVFAMSEYPAFQRSFGTVCPDVICLDLGMPYVDGVEVLGFLADKQYGGALFIISGFDPTLVGSALRLAEARGLKVAGTIPKPIKIDALKILLRQVGQDR